MNNTNARIATALGIVFAFATATFAQHPSSDDLPVIRPKLKSRFANAGWAYDRYHDLESLDAGRRMVVADLTGPGIIRHFHSTRHFPEDLMSRGIVLEIWFDDADEPAVLCPLADFFGDGCNGAAEDFTSNLIECAPWSYNCYIPMPFRHRARVILRNDTDQDAANYSYVEWEPLPSWEDNLGYFHATYERQCFQLKPITDITLLEVEGAGHVLGRQFSIVTDEPWFRGFFCVMEGNNEIDIDGRERAIDYLGTEDPFTFSWGFQNTFAGQHAGIRFVEQGDVNRLSVYRFHDAMPIRFRRSLRWHINWSYERAVTQNPLWQEALSEDGCWLDVAAVHYWYQDSPGGFKHEPLRLVEERTKPLLRSSRKTVDFGDSFKDMPTDSNLSLELTEKKDMKRVAIVGCYADTHPFWIDQPKPQGGHPGQPNPGRQGILAVHPRDQRTPCGILRKVALPKADRLTLEVSASGDPYELPGQSDFILQLGVFDGKETTWFEKHTVDAGDKPASNNWNTIGQDLTPYAGTTAGIIVKISAGGPKHGWANEEAFIDAINIRTD